MFRMVHMVCRIYQTWTLFERITQHDVFDRNAKRHFTKPVPQKSEKTEAD